MSSTMRRLGVAALCLVHLASVFAQSAAPLPRSVVEDYGKERYDKSIPAIQAAALQGDLEAAGLLCEAQMLGRGMARATKISQTCVNATDSGSALAKGVFAAHLVISKIQRDIPRGAKLAEEASRAGDARGELVLGHLRYYGMDGPRDLAAARVHYRLARERGSGTASYYLATYYLDGYGGVQRDNDEGLAYLQEALQRRSPDAMLLTGKLYEQGYLLRQDPERALYYYRMAADRHQGEAGYLAYLALQAAAKGTEVGQEARDRLLQAVEDGDGRAAFVHAQNLYRGTYGAADKKAAVGWFRAAAAEGVSRGNLMAAVALTETGNGRDLRDGRQEVIRMVRQREDLELSLEAGIVLSYLIAQRQAPGNQRDIQALLGDAEANTSNQWMRQAARQARSDIARMQREREEARATQQNAAGAAVLALIFAGILVSAHHNGESSKSEDKEESTIDRINRGIQRNNARLACLAGCPSNSVYTSMCKDSCNSE